MGYGRLQWVTVVYNGLRSVTMGYGRLQWVTVGYNGLR